MAPRRDKECLAASSLSLDCGLPKNDCSLTSSDTGTRLGELPDFCLSQTQFPYLDHGMVPLPARLPGRIAAQLPALALCTLSFLCPGAWMTAS